jgi:hypothetical protein
MRKYLLVCWCALLPLFLVAQPKVIISELLYQPPYPNEGQNPHMHNGEFISIYNYGNEAVNVSGWYLISRQNNTAEQRFTFPPNSILQPRAKFYVAYRGLQSPNFYLDSLYRGFRLGVNDLVWYQRIVVLNNTGEWLALYHQDGTTQDSLWHSSGPLVTPKNADWTTGYECFSIQRHNVGIANGIVEYSPSDWATNRTVALEKYPTPDLGLTENGVDVFHRIKFAYDADGNLESRTIIFPALLAPMAKASSARGSKNNSSEENDSTSNSEDDYALNEEDDFSLFSAMEMPENNNQLDQFYTDKLNESDVVIYPNPTKGALAIEIRNKNPQTPHHLTVYSLNGTTIFQRSNIDNYTQIDLSSQPKGVYLMRISAENSFITWRIVKE